MMESITLYPWILGVFIIFFKISQNGVTRISQITNSLKLTQVAPDLTKSIPQWAFDLGKRFSSLKRFERVLKFCGIGEPQTGLRIQSGVQPELWTELRSSSLGFRFEPKFGTELWQH